jgi:hypothetical protein
MSAYEHLLNPSVQKSAAERKTPWHAIRWFVNPLHFVLSRTWSCWHRRMSRPFTRDGETYRVCLRCGVHRHFDLDAWRTKGSYYYDKKVKRPAETSSSHGSAVPTRTKLRLIA